jgi:hypothetical protein
VHLLSCSHREADPVAICLLFLLSVRFSQDGIFDHITCLGGDEYEYKDHKRQNKNDGVIFTPEDDDYWSANARCSKSDIVGGARRFA